MSFAPKGRLDRIVSINHGDRILDSYNPRTGETKSHVHLGHSRTIFRDRSGALWTRYRYPDVRGGRATIWERAEARATNPVEDVRPRRQRERPDTSPPKPTDKMRRSPKRGHRRNKPTISIRSK